MNIKQVARKHRRLPGEIAFDRCFLPLVALSVLSIAFALISDWDHPSGWHYEKQLVSAMPPPIWHTWLWFALGLLLAALWFHAIVSLVRAWRDPSSRFLRFSASVLLIPFAVATFQLLFLPFH